jgi:hypothetical protein
MKFYLETLKVELKLCIDQGSIKIIMDSYEYFPNSREIEQQLKAEILGFC